MPAVRRLFSALKLALPRVVTYREENAAATQDRLLPLLQTGQTVALVSDAGTPGISDPGWKLVAACLDSGIPVFSVPGPSSVTAAVAVAGLPTRRFLFAGFPPHAGSERREFFQDLARQTVTTVFLESPHRIVDALKELRECCELDRRLCICRELTKVHESSGLRRLEDWCQDPPPARGEFVLVLAASEQAPETIVDYQPHARYLAECGMNAAQIRHYLIQFCGMSRNEAYKAALEATRPS